MSRIVALVLLTRPKYRSICQLMLMALFEFHSKTMLCVFTTQCLLEAPDMFPGHGTVPNAPSNWSGASYENGFLCNKHLNTPTMPDMPWS